MAVLLLNPYQQFYDENGDPLSGGKVYTYQAGTTTPKATFTDSTEVTQASNPVILDSAGRATMWGAGSYKFVVTTADDVPVRTTDNVTTYNTADALGNSYFEQFSGNGTQTVFTVSQDLGTDENSIMVFVADGLEQHVANGDFATDTIWTKGAGWTIGSGVATATGAISTVLSQTSTVTLIAGQSYNLIYTVTRTAGGIIPSIGNTSGTERTVSGTYRETIIAQSTQTIAFTGNAFTGTIDNVSVTPVDAKGYDIQSPNSYTINGTTLTFGTAPAVGTGNIYVFAPSLLVASANAAAAAADASATLAANSAAAAAISEGNADAAAIAAAASFDDFDDRYLGAKAADPTLDNDGNALIVGALYFNTVSNLMKAWDGAAWLIAYNPAASDMFKSVYDPANVNGQLAGVDFNQSFTKGQRGTPVQLTQAATIATDLALGNFFYTTMTDNRTLGTPTNMVAGQSGSIEIIQSTGSHTLAYSADWLFPGGTDPVLSTAAGAIDILCYQVNQAGTKVYANLLKGMA
jgi:hypothetical protein